MPLFFLKNIILFHKIDFFKKSPTLPATTSIEPSRLLVLKKVENSMVSIFLNILFFAINLLIKKRMIMDSTVIVPISTVKESSEN